MQNPTISIKGDIYFKIRFNTMHGDTDFYWRVIIDEREFLACSVRCKVETYSDKSFDKNANTIKYHIAGKCTEFCITEDNTALFI